MCPRPSVRDHKEHALKHAYRMPGTRGLARKCVDSKSSEKSSWKIVSLNRFGTPPGRLLGCMNCFVLVHLFHLTALRVDWTGSYLHRRQWQLGLSGLEARCQARDAWHEVRDQESATMRSKPQVRDRESDRVLENALKCIGWQSLVDLTLLGPRPGKRFQQWRQRTAQWPAKVLKSRLKSRLGRLEKGRLESIKNLDG